MSVAELLQDGIHFQRDGRRKEAEEIYRRILEIAPDNLDARHMLGVLLIETSRASQAITALREVVARKPNYSASWRALCIALRQVGDYAAALAAGERAISLGNRGADLLDVVGWLALQGGDVARAIHYGELAVAQDPNLVEARHNLAIALNLARRFEQAAAHYRRAIEFEPDNAQLRYNNALNEMARGNIGDSMVALEGALAANKDHVAARYMLAWLRRLVCDWHGHEHEALPRLLAEHCDSSGPVRLSPLYANAMPLPADLKVRLAERFATQVSSAVLAERSPFHHDQPQSKVRLRIGYLAPDMRVYGAGTMLNELQAAHIVDGLEVILYSLTPAAEHVVDLSVMSTVEAASRIHADQLDILVDVGGYIEGARPDILALRPAPIQVSWLGYLNTMGALFVDFVLADAVALPPGEEVNWREKVVRLPGCFLAPSPLPAREPSPSRAELGLPDDAVVLAGFNHTLNLSPELFASWMAVLRDVPGTVLWLVAGNRLALGNLEREIAAAGVDGSRVVFADAIPMPAHIARLANADLFLDSFGVNASAGALSAAAAGVPMLTCAGREMAARVGASINTQLGLEELVTNSPDAYTRKLIELARDRDGLARLKDGMAARVKQSKLLDANAFAHKLGRAYADLWARHAAGLAPDHLDVDSA